MAETINTTTRLKIARDGRNFIELSPFVDKLSLIISAPKSPIRNI